MPRVPRIGEVNLPAATQVAPRVNPDSFTGPSRAVEQAASQVSRIGRDIQRKAEQVRQRQEAAAASQASAQFRVESAQKLSELSRQENPYGLGEQYQEWASQRKQAYLDQLESDGAKLTFSTRFDDIAATGAINAIQTEATRTIETNVRQLNESISTTANAIYSQPGAFDEYLNQTLEDLEAMGSIFSPEGRKAKKEEIENTYAMAALQSRVELGDPNSVLDELEKGEWDSYLTGNNKARMVAAANRAVQMEEKRRSLENQALGEEIQDVLGTAMEDLKDGYQPRTPMEEAKQMLEGYDGPDKAQLERRAEVLSVYGERLQQFALAPAAARQDEINALRAKRQRQEASDEEIELLDLYEDQHSRIQKEARKDAVSLAARVGVIRDYQQLNMSDPEPSALAAREQQMQVIRKQWGEQAMPLTTPEYESLVQQLQQDPRQVSTLIGKLAGSWSPKTMRVVGSRLQQDDPAMAMAFVRAQDQPDLSEMIVKGREVLRQTKELDFPDELVSANVSNVYGDLFRGNPQARRSAIEAAKAVTAYNLKGDMPRVIGNREYQDSLRLVMGGELQQNGQVKGGPFEFRGQKVIPPAPGMTEREFADIVDSLEFDELVTYGRQYNPATGGFSRTDKPPTYADGTPVDAEDVAYYATFVSVGDGYYGVEMPGGSLSIDGQPYIINLRELAR